MRPKMSLVRKKSLVKFRQIVWSHYRANKRDMPWRRDHSPFNVVVSEIMLQQTQVSRVIPKFDSFIKKFPDWKTLAKASTKSVLKEWSGLGYNRRALYLKRIAIEATTNKEFDFLKSGKSGGGGTSPISRHFTQVKRLETIAALRALPGIGPNTAGSIVAFAFNLPVQFIETNIRSVFIHHFFKKTRRKISDDKLMPLIEMTLDQKNPREWYYALMDYGSYLKTAGSGIENPSRKSSHHVKQPPFKGSNRELRSRILRLILKRPATKAVIMAELGDGRLGASHRMSIMKNIKDLTREGFIFKRDNSYQIA